MNRMPPLLLVIVWGAVASLIVAGIFLFFDRSGVFLQLGVKMSVSNDLLNFFGRKAIEGGVAGLLFLLPFWQGLRQWKRGIGFGVIFSFYYFLYFFPTMGFGYFGINFGLAVTAVGFITAVLWGIFTGALLQWSRYRA